jgi:hypothetical protein
MISPLKTCLTGLVAAALLSSAAAQTSSSTPVIGYYKQAFAQAGVYAVSVGFVNKNDFQGQASSAPGVVGSVCTISQTGATWSNNQFATLTPGPSHYVEVISDTTHPEYAGMILDITGNAPTSITCTAVAGFAPSASMTYAVRKHVLLGELLGDGSGVAAYEDLVVVYGADGSELNASYEGAGVWKDALNPAVNLSNHVLYPGHGFVFLPADVRTLTIGGGAISYVKSGPTRVSLSAGIPALLGLVNPLVPSSPTDPILTTTGTGDNTLTEMGLRDPANVNVGLLPDTDSVTILSNDGFYTTVNTIGKNPANNLVELIESVVGNLNGLSLLNGQAVFYYPGDNSSLLLPQRH